jgi:hypothetical protein
LRREPDAGTACNPAIEPADDQAANCAVARIESEAICVAGIKTI